MGRQNRIHFPGAVFHVTARGVDGRDVFIHDAERRRFLASLNRLADELHAAILAYCLMGNHFHLVVRVGSVPLARLMQRLVGSYARYFNLRHERKGHLFQARYDARICLTDAYLLNTIAYIHRNPVRAGFCRNPEDWAWSSYRARAAAGLADNLDPDFTPWAEIESHDLNLARAAKTEMKGLDALAREVSDRFRAGPDAVKSADRRRSAVKLRQAFAREAIRAGHPAIVIAKFMGMAPNAVTRYIQK
jgi:REP element-mobilizing transposase RayT